MMRLSRIGRDWKGQKGRIGWDLYSVMKDALVVTGEMEIRIV